MNSHRYDFKDFFILTLYNNEFSKMMPNPKSKTHLLSKTLVKRLIFVELELFVVANIQMIKFRFAKTFKFKDNLNFKVLKAFLGSISDREKKVFFKPFLKL